MTGNASLDKILLLIFTIVALSSFGLFFYSTTMITPEPINPDAELGSLKDEARMRTQIEPVSLKKLTINLYSRSTRLRFLDVQLNILPFTPEGASIIKDKEALIADTVIEKAGEMTPDELNSVSGKILLEEKIKKYINSLHQEPLIKKIYFSRFVIQ